MLPDESIMGETKVRRLWSDKRNLEGASGECLEYLIPDHQLGRYKMEYTTSTLPTSEPNIEEVVCEAILSTLRGKILMPLKEITNELVDAGYSQKAIRKGKELFTSMFSVKVVRTGSGDTWELIERKDHAERDSFPSKQTDHEDSLKIFEDTLNEIVDNGES